MAYSEDKLTPTGGGNFWNSRKPKTYGIVAGILLAAIVFWKIIATSGNEPPPKSKMQKQVEAVKKQTEGVAAKVQPVDSLKLLDITEPDFSTGDKTANAKLQEAIIRQETEQKKRAEAERKAQMKAEYDQYQRKVLQLPHVEPLAEAWEKRMQAAKEQGGPTPVPEPLDAESVEILKTANPALLTQAQGGGRTPTGVAVQQGAAPPATLPSAPGGQRPAPTSPSSAALAPATGAGATGAVPPPASGSAAPVSAAGGSGAPAIPSSIDPETGLPRDAVQRGMGGDSIWAVLSDGSPDIAGGAVPFTYQYVPHGGSQPVTVTKWVRPEFLLNRPIPYEARELANVTQSYWNSIRQPTTLTEDKVTQAIRIPMRRSSGKYRAGGAGDFVSENHYVRVYPNPDGELAPPNPKPGQHRR